MLYNIGDRVMVKQHIQDDACNEDCPSMNDDMAAFIGSIVTIREHRYGGYRIVEDTQNHMWTDCMFRYPTEAEIIAYRVKEKQKEDALRKAREAEVKKFRCAKPFARYDFKLSDHIKAIGIEFEGFYSIGFIEFIKRNLMGTYINDIGYDGSLHGDENTIRYSLRGQELRGQPLDTADKLKYLLEIYQGAQDSNNYYINNSVGLHFHISLSEHVYGKIDCIEFYNDYIKMFRKNYPIIYENRKTSRYSRSSLAIMYPHRSDTLRKQIHFSTESSTRYAMINYCYRRHGTVEFRGFGGFGATFEGLYNMIADTSALIDLYAKKEQVVDGSVAINVPKQTCGIVQQVIKVNSMIHQPTSSYNYARMSNFINNEFDMKFKISKGTKHINIVIPKHKQADFIPF